jgi:YidC/Oxa1 family membrane protein insertase
MQENKNMLLAIVLCLAVLFGWSYVADYMGWSQRPVTGGTQEATEPQRAAPVPKTPETPSLPTMTFSPAPGRDIPISTPLYEAVIHSGGGTLRSFLLRDFRTSLGNDAPHINMVSDATASVAPLGLLVNGQPSWSTGSWNTDTPDAGIVLTAGERRTLSIQGEADQFQVTRRLEISADSYLIRETVSMTNASPAPRTLRIGFTVATDDSNAHGGQYDSMRIAWDRDGKLNEETSTSTLETSGVQEAGKIFWAGAMSTYFLSAVVPTVPETAIVKGRLMQKHIYRTALEMPEVIIPSGQTIDYSTGYWFGPKIRSELLAISEPLAKSIDLGMFSLIAKGLLWLLGIFHAYVNNWGIAIIMLTIVIKAAFWPLTAKSYASMEKMKKLNPAMTAIREKYKDNKEMMNKEVMALYKTYGVNPASGCVPILIQLPVFFGLYQALLTSIELRHAPFVVHLPFTDYFWLADLSSQDPFYITPIIMGATMFLQQKMSPPPTDPTQQKIMMFLPLIFTVLFLNFPSGLVLYWLVNNILSIAQQWLMIRKQKPSPSQNK